MRRYCGLLPGANDTVMFCRKPSMGSNPCGFPGRREVCRTLATEGSGSQPRGAIVAVAVAVAVAVVAVAVAVVVVVVAVVAAAAVVTVTVVAAAAVKHDRSP